MLNRRHLRTKVLQSLYAHFQSGAENYAQTQTQMMASIDRIYDLYIYLLLIFPELKVFAIRKIEENKRKLRPSSEDLNPNRKFVDNIIIRKIESNELLLNLADKRKINWLGDEKQEIFRKMFQHIRESEVYFEHMNNKLEGFQADKQFLIDLFKEEIANFPALYNFFEEMHIDWLDDIDIACNMTMKTISNIEQENDELRVMSLHKDEQDEQEFVRTLLRKTIAMNAENEQIIEELTKNWELDRIAKMDVILLKMAITELQVFKSIPTKVTLNEYIEISKFYSTPKSNTFINGILDKAIDKLNADNKILKMGRGIL